MFRYLIIVLTVIVVEASVLCAQESIVGEKSEITCTLMVKDTIYDSPEDISIVFMLKNNSLKNVSILKWNTPLEGFNSDMLIVKHDRKQVEYVGRLLKRGKPKPENYVTIAPGKSISSKLNLADGYALYKAANYSVQFKSNLVDFGFDTPEVLAQSALTNYNSKSIESNQITFELRKGTQINSDINNEVNTVYPDISMPSELDLLDTIEAVKQRTVYNDCTSDQEDELETALENALNHVFISYWALALTEEGNRAISNRYTTWFGNYDSSRYSEVMVNYLAIFNALDQQEITFNCDCDLSAYAYVYPNSPYEIWLCNAFWSAPDVGTDSQMGVLIHETSHFTVVADTDDHAYGHSACKTLADNSPNLAIENADSYEYFSENDPVLEMGVNLINAMLFFVILLYFKRIKDQRRNKDSSYIS